jgi:hypothetical protein
MRLARRIGRPLTVSGSGMPGFNQELFTTQMWQVSLLLARSDKLPESVKIILASPNVAGPREVVGAKSPNLLKQRGKTTMGTGFHNWERPSETQGNKHRSSHWKRAEQETTR